MEITTKQEEALGLYSSLVLSWNDCFNLTGAKTQNEFYSEHIEFSIRFSSYLEEYIASLSSTNSISFADIGSGAGIPIIPLAVLLNKYNISFQAVERSHKRCVFLRYINSLLRSKGYINSDIRIMECDLKNLNSKFDIITFCALSKVQKIEKDLIRLIKPSGCIFAPKGTYENALNEIKNIDKLKGELCNIGSEGNYSATVLKLYL